MKITLPILGIALKQSDKYSVHQNATYCNTTAQTNESPSHTTYTPTFMEPKGPLPVTGPYTKLGQFSAQHNLSWSIITENFSTIFKMVFTSLTFLKFALLADSYTEDTESQSIKVECFPVLWDSFQISCILVTCSEVTM
jgi:hypothetical protein